MGFVLFTKYNLDEILVNTDHVFAVEKRSETQCWLRFAVTRSFHVDVGDHAPYSEAVIGTLYEIEYTLRGGIGATTLPRVVTP